MSSATARRPSSGRPAAICRNHSPRILGDPRSPPCEPAWASTRNSPLRSYGRSRPPGTHVLPGAVLNAVVIPAGASVRRSVIRVEPASGLVWSSTNPCSVFAVRAVDHLGGNVAGLTVLHPHHRLLPHRPPARLFSPLGLTHVLPQSADVGLVHFHWTVQLPGVFPSSTPPAAGGA